MGKLSSHAKAHIQHFGKPDKSMGSSPITTGGADYVKSAKGSAKVPTQPAVKNDPRGTSKMPRGC
jgi:hypothetical protein